MAQQELKAFTDVLSTEIGKNIAQMEDKINRQFTGTRCEIKNELEKNISEFSGKIETFGKICLGSFAAIIILQILILIIK